jgi:O-phospho-L-seryl-tRNASec:L-selenocysteinyl-tRNA synthase
LQPKAVGSSLLVQLTNSLLKNFLHSLGMSFIKNLVILPFATGMAISLSLLTLAAEKPVINNNIECEICNMAENRSKDLF